MRAMQWSWEDYCNTPGRIIEALAEQLTEEYNESENETWRRKLS